MRGAVDADRQSRHDRPRRPRPSRALIRAASARPAGVGRRVPTTATVRGASSELAVTQAVDHGRWRIEVAQPARVVGVERRERPEPVVGDSLQRPTAGSSGGVDESRPASAGSMGGRPSDLPFSRTHASSVPSTAALEHVLERSRTAPSSWPKYDSPIPVRRGEHDPRVALDQRVSVESLKRRAARPARAAGSRSAAAASTSASVTSARSVEVGDRPRHAQHPMRRAGAQMLAGGNVLARAAFADRVERAGLEQRRPGEASVRPAAVPLRAPALRAVA